MTMPVERTRAVLQTLEFLKMLSVAKGMPAEIKLEAQRLLRHFPCLGDMKLTATVCPILWSMPEGYEPGPKQSSAPRF